MDKFKMSISEFIEKVLKKKRILKVVAFENLIHLLCSRG